MTGDPGATGAPADPDFPVVGIGASAGGLEALGKFFENIPANTGIAFVVVTHQHPGHTSLLPELLAKKTTMPVIEASDGMKLETDHVYVGPASGHLAILDGTLHRMEAESAAAPRLPIDYFFRSLAEDKKERAICIVLSGTGTDGTLGLRAVKSESGMAMVERPESAKYAGMPSSAIATGLVDYVLAPDDMGKALIAYSQGSYVTGTGVATAMPAVPAEPMQKIFLLMRRRTGHDFSDYKPNTLHRRIERRMNVHQIKDTDEYVRYLQAYPHEIDILFKELLISVTTFFRDADAWDAFASRLEKQLRSWSDDDSLRVWVPGCATGEEAYSVAIVLREAMEKTKRQLDVQIFGTDLDAEAIERARAGRYPDGIGVDVSPPRLDRWFLREDGGYLVRKEIREMVIFAPQDVITDPPFTKLDILCCRNLLIYLSSDLQKKLLPLFHYALKPDAMLFLGPSETVGSSTDLFEPLDNRWKIYRRKEGIAARSGLPQSPERAPQPAEAGGPVRPGPAPAARAGDRTVTVIERTLLERFAPASVVVNERGDIVYIHGRTGMYLEPSQGQPRNNILEMAREGLDIDLGAAIRQCVSKDPEIVHENVRVKANGGFVHVTVSVSKLREPEPVRGLYLVSFRPAPPPEPPPAPQEDHGKGGEDGRVRQLERELQYLKESHATTLEELETSNEELKSTNEELLSTNEELQSTNEELESSKEELQSLNEELTTVNAELQVKVDELSRANDDMQNLLNSTDIATVFLDRHLNITRYTEHATDVVTLRQADIGRPLSELTSTLVDTDLAAACRKVLETLLFQEQEVRTQDGSWYLMRVMPYRTSENVIAGVVLTFVELDQVKETEQASARARTYFETIFNTLRTPLTVLDEGLNVVTCNSAFYNTFKTNARQTEGRRIYDLDAVRWDMAELRRLLEEILPRETQLHDYRVSAEFPRIGRRTFLLNARRLEQEAALPGRILLVMEEVPNE